jgi:hypothetical protein
MKQTKEIKPVYKGHNYVGEKIGEWEVLNEGIYTQTGQGGRYKWLCKCSCGTIKYVGITSLLYGRTKMCIQCAITEKNKAMQLN